MPAGADAPRRWPQPLQNFWLAGFAWPHPAHVSSRLMGVAVAVSLIGAWIARRLDHVYAGVIEKRLVTDGVAADLTKLAAASSTYSTKPLMNR